MDRKRFSGLKIQFCTLHVIQLLLMCIVSLLSFIHKTNDFWVLFVFFFDVTKELKGICCVIILFPLCCCYFDCTCSPFAASWSHQNFCTPVLWATTWHVSEIEDWSEEVKKTGYFDYKIFYGQQYLLSTNLLTIQTLMSLLMEPKLIINCLSY